MGLVCGVGCVAGAQRDVRYWGLFFESVSEATFFDLGAILGGFWEAKMVPKSIFGRFFGSLFSHAISAAVLGVQNGGQNRFLGRFFSMLFSNAFRHRFWIVFWRLRTLKIELSPRREHEFYKIDVFKK